MRPQRRLTWAQFIGAADRLAKQIHPQFRAPVEVYSGVYGIPTGGSVVALAMAQVLGLPILDAAEREALVVDDICDSGRTLEPYRGNHATAVLHCRRQSEGLVDFIGEVTEDWIVYPYEHKASGGGTEIVTRLLEFIGEDPTRPGLAETPARVVRMWGELFAGYKAVPTLTAFETQQADELVLCRDIDFYSTCEHHLLPFYGKAHVGYLPNGKVLGLSKMPRIVETYARRLQLQERMTSEIADSVETATGARGVGVVIEGQHLCLMIRGVKQANVGFTTSAVRGLLRTEPAARAEFFALVGRNGA